jgi:ubiquinone/menaquinone biosynthesis C-methylase UbiE
VYSVNLLECVPDKLEFISECNRVLKPGGRILIAHFDWDTQTFDGEDRALVRRIVQAFNDWQQPWMVSADPWMGRRLARCMAEEGSFIGEMHAYTLLSQSFSPESYGRRQAESFEALARRGLISQDDYASFMEFLQDSAARDAFFYSVTLFAFVGHKRGADS